MSIPGEQRPAATASIGLQLRGTAEAIQGEKGQEPCGSRGGQNRTGEVDPPCHSRANETAMARAATARGPKEAASC